MSELIYSLYMLYAFDEGIVPLRNFATRRPPEDVRADLAAMSPDEARKAKRKFRKMWRKYMKNQGGSISRGDMVDGQIMSKATRSLRGR